jgi:hypothetical protein
MPKWSRLLRSRRQLLPKRGTTTPARRGRARWKQADSAAAIRDELQAAAESQRELAATRETLSQQLTAEQENFLQRFQVRMAEALDSGVRDAQGKIQEGFAPLWLSIQQMTEKQREELRASLANLSSEATGEYKTRLENVSNTWLLTTVAKLDHQSRDVVTGLSASAEEKLRAACAEVFSNVGESLRKRLQELTAEFGKPAAPRRSRARPQG